MSNEHYNLQGVLETTSAFGFTFVGTGELELLQKKVSHVVSIPVIYFPYDEAQQIDAGAPRRYNFTGLLLSALLTEKETKGRFIFNDGTIVYYDKSILD